MCCKDSCPMCISLEQNQYSTPFYACNFISLVANMRGRTFSHEIVEACRPTNWGPTWSGVFWACFLVGIMLLLLLKLIYPLFVGTADEEPDMDLHGMAPMGGRGFSTMTRPTTWSAFGWTSLPRWDILNASVLLHHGKDVLKPSTRKWMWWLTLLLKTGVTWP